MKRLSILGAGWLGSEVACSFKNEFHIKVSTTSKEKLQGFEAMGFEPFLLCDEDLSVLDEFLSCDILLVCVPPSKAKNYLDFLNTVIITPNFSLISQTLFISSTSVYSSTQGLYSEDSSLNESTVVYEAEALVQKHFDVILRCAGLMGKNRIAGKYFAGQEVLDAKSNVNHVHLNDVIKAIGFCISNNLSGIYNVCAPLHPSKKEVYTLNAKRYDFESPVFKNEKVLKRVINHEKLEQLGFEYDYPNPLEF